MVERFDVVLENYRVGTLDKLGIAYDKARLRNPWHYLLFGIGLWPDRAVQRPGGSGLIVQAESGMISINGEPGSRGVRNGVSIADMVAGMGGLRHHERPAGEREDGQGTICRCLHARRPARPVTGNYRGLHGGWVVPEPMGTAYKAPAPLPDLPHQNQRFGAGRGQ